MKYFRNLKIRTKLVLTFVFVSLLVAVLAFTIPQFSIGRLTKQSIPFLDLTGQVSITGGAIQREILEYVNSGQLESIDEFDEDAEDLRAQITELRENYAGLISEGDLNALEQVMTELVTTGQAVIVSHTKTLENLERLEETEINLAGMREKEDTLKTEEGQELLHEISETAKVLQLEAIEFIATSENKTVNQFSEHEAEFRKLQKTAVPALLAAEPDAADFVTTFEQVTRGMAVASRAVVDSHTETLAGMGIVERLEARLEERLGNTARVAAQEIQSGQSEVRTSFMVTAILMLMLAIGFGFIITRSVVKPIGRLSENVRRVGKGDLSARAEVNSRDEIGQLAQMFNQMTSQLQESFALAEQESARRIHELEVTASISRQLTTMLDVDQALQHVVTQIQQSFNYYHVHIYLTDRETSELVMREGSGDVGKQLKARGHRLQPGQGIVGQVATSAQALLVPNVDDMPHFVRNPLLPKTQSELAVPLRKGALILGVLDIQSEEIAVFDDEDLTLIQTIADQIAVVVDNARLFRETREAVAEAETLSRRLTLAKWSDISERATSGYIFTKSGVNPIAFASSAGDEESWLPIMSEAVTRKELSYHGSDRGNGNDQSYLSIPLILRNQVIGVIGIERSASANTEGESGSDSSGPVSWNDDEITAIQQITEQITLALDSARLAQETQRAAWRDRLVSESTAQVWATDEIEEVMRAAVEQLGDRLHASEVVIRLGKEDDLQSE